MNYVYDILLNFNNSLIEYFEWNETDNIKYIKKIIIFKTDTDTIKDIKNNYVVLDTAFTTNIPKYEINNKKEEGKICLLTDSKIVIGLLIKNNKVEQISRLLLDEEYDALEISNNLITTKIKYKVINKRKNINNTLTRKEFKIQEQLQVELDNLYKNKNIDKLIYLYYEYTNEENKNIDYIYKTLKSSLNNFSEKHIKLYNILSSVNETQQ